MIPDRSNKKTWPAVTWSLMMTGQLMVVPTRVCTRMSKSASVGEAELHTGILMWCRPGKSFRQGVVIEIVTIELIFGFVNLTLSFVMVTSLSPSITLERVTSSFSSTSFSTFLTTV